MADIERINAHLQARLIAESRAEVIAMEAARWLEEQGLLANRKDRPGQSLRKLVQGPATQCEKIVCGYLYLEDDPERWVLTVRLKGSQQELVSTPDERTFERSLTRSFG